MAALPGSVRGHVHGQWVPADPLPPRCYEGALQLQRQAGDARGAALSLNNLCLVAQQRGNFADLARSVDERQLSWDRLLDATSLWNRLGQGADVHVGLGELRS